MKIQKDQENSNKNQQQSLNEKAIKSDQLREAVDSLEKEAREKEKKYRITKKKENEIIKEKANNEATKERIKVDLNLMTNQYESNKKIVEEDQKEIEQKMRQRDLLNKDVVTAEEDERRK